MLTRINSLEKNISKGNFAVFAFAGAITIMYEVHRGMGV